ncbi:uncharacterized protein K452DRAFT_280141 [Aplosporella prunicola CBS 121167]|uniref:Uncharacterized protein n=1 Tax=Aplosporella prunicola CBS 121167 TaxID=1176127 RepID=A0A6A6AYN7_9PEZI|nr:uncharacterized protein K452DRAFT_280141 [Aplosporella prunicola CBS 121167]KAF2136303.1 hypothetical protein K452DRAFT_280141 [Aplosporella prunicola CBS 121167]
MPPPKRHDPSTIGAQSPFDPDAFLATWSAASSLPLQNNDLRTAIIRAFDLPPTDDYVYHAVASVTLAQVQHALGFGGKHGLHGWYVAPLLLPPPPPADVEAYTAVFAAGNATLSALRALGANAKKGSLRKEVAAHLTERLFLAAPEATLTLPNKKKNPFPNPYHDIWAWSCRALEWAGPVPSTAHTKISHHVLPVLYHHFGCIVPSWDAISLLQQLAAHAPPRPKPKAWQREILDLGSGNGYWSFLLRRAGLRVTPVDSGVSEWRTMWVGDTVRADGVGFLKEREGAREAVLLLVYPQVGARFTESVLRAYKGDYVVVAGTQNANGYTGFSEETVASWMRREMPDFVPCAQVPLPSFAGKDEALFVFVRRGEE